MTDTPGSPELLPCPFCGGPATRLEGKYDHGGTYNEAGCDNVGCQVLPSALQLSQEGADTAWNRRVDTRPAPATVRVKPLEWDEADGIHRSQGPLHMIEVFPNVKGTWTLEDGMALSEHGSEAAAKEAGRAVLERRILAALSPVPVEGLRPDIEGSHLVAALRQEGYLVPYPIMLKAMQAAALATYGERGDG
jgi:hypothetical protein